MKIAVAGKGGSGKTTLAGTLARLLARRGRTVLAVDADSNPNLAVSLGLSREATAAIESVPRDTGGTSADELTARYGVRAPDGVTLLVMGRVGHAGAG